MQTNNVEYVFDRRFSPKHIAIKITDKYIEMHKTHNSKPVKVFFKDILNIKFMNNKNLQFVIYTKNNENFSMDALVINDIESLINLLNKKHKTITDYNFQYDSYINATESSNVRLIFSISLFLIFFLFMFWIMSTKNYHVSKYDDKNLTIRKIHRTGFICPSNYQTINKTNIENKYIYRYECGFFYKTKLIYEKNITESEIQNIYLDDGAGMFTSTELFKYWIEKI